jgi:hypothetical protein
MITKVLETKLKFKEFSSNYVKEIATKLREMKLCKQDLLDFLSQDYLSVDEFIELVKVADEVMEEV